MPKKIVSQSETPRLKPSVQSKELDEFANQLLSDEAISRNTDSQVLDDKHLVMLIKEAINNPRPKKRSELLSSAELFASIRKLPTKMKRLSNQNEKLIMVVDGLFEFFKRDPNLKQSIKLLLAELRGPVLLLALSDKSLLLEQQHVARLLLNEICKISLYWHENNSQTQVIYQQISEVVEQITTQSCDTPDIRELFSSVTNSFLRFTTNFRNRTEVFEKRIRESTTGKTKINAAKHWANSQIDKTLQIKNIPEFVQHFLSQAWLHILFLEKLRADKRRVNFAIFLAQALLVSLQAVKTVDELEKFLELQSVLIEGLQANIEKSSYSLSEIKLFFEDLDLLHNDVITKAKATLEKAPKEAILRLKPANPLDIEQKTNHTQVKEPTISISKLSLGQWVLDVFNALPKSKKSEYDLTTSKNKKSNEIAPKDKQVLGQLNLKPGCWVELFRDNEKFHYKLASYLPGQESYIFINGSGLKAAEYNADEIIKLTLSGKMRLLDSSPIFDRAFDAALSNLHKEEINQQSNHSLESKSSIPLDESPQVKNKIIKNTVQLKIEISQPNKETISLLPVGSWVEIKINDTMKKCRLAAKIPSTGKLIFTDRSGIKMKEGLLDEIAKLYQSGELIINQKHEVFDDALASVISSMRDLKSEKS